MTSAQTVLKKNLVILFAFIYLIPAIGFSIDLHWCGKKVKIVYVNSSHESRCPCGTNMPFGCCKDVHLTLKIVDAQKSTDQIIVPCSVDFKQICTYVVPSIVEPFSKIVAFDFSNYHAPPFKSKTPVYLTNSIFRI